MAMNVEELIRVLETYPPESSVRSAWRFGLIGDVRDEIEFGEHVCYLLPAGAPQPFTPSENDSVETEAGLTDYERAVLALMIANKPEEIPTAVRWVAQEAVEKLRLPVQVHSEAFEGGGPMVMLDMEGNPTMAIEGTSAEERKELKQASQERTALEAGDEASDAAVDGD
jgi:hypothetical protein